MFEYTESEFMKAARKSNDKARKFLVSLFNTDGWHTPITIQFNDRYDYHHDKPRQFGLSFIVSSVNGTDESIQQAKRMIKAAKWSRRELAKLNAKFNLA